MRDRIRNSAVDVGFAGLALSGLLGVFALIGLLEDRLAVMWMIASFGASITLFLAMPGSPPAQPYAALLGNVGSAVVGAAAWALLGHAPAQALFAALLGAVMWMSLARAWHPPGGATAMLAVVGGPTVHSLGWLYPLCPIAVGTAWLLVLSVVRQRLLSSPLL